MHKFLFGLLAGIAGVFSSYAELGSAKSVCIICSDEITITVGGDVPTTVELGMDPVTGDAWGMTDYAIPNARTTLQAPERLDYRFVGWYTLPQDDTSGAATSVSQCTQLLSDKIEIDDAVIGMAKKSFTYEVVCPKYIPTIRVDLTVSPKEAGTNFVYACSDTKYALDGKISYGETCTLKAKPEAGYVFAYWEKEVKILSDEVSYSFIAEATSGGTYTAVFTGKVYSVTLDRQTSEPGGTSMVQLQYGEALPPIVTPTKYGWDFKGYYDANDGAGTQYYDSAGNGLRLWDKVENNLALRAYWTPKSYPFRVRFSEGIRAICHRLTTSSAVITNYHTQTEFAYNYANGATVEAYALPEQGYKVNDHDVEHPTLLSVIPPDGITFSPHASAITICHTVRFIDDACARTNIIEVADGMGASAPKWERMGYSLGWSDDFSKVVNDMTVYAVWHGNPYVIRFNPNGASGMMSDIMTFYGQEVELPACAFENGIRAFTHWTTTVDVVCGKSVMITPTNIADCATVSNMTVMANGTNMLYAVWGNDYLVAFDGNGATSGHMDNQHFVRGERKPLSANGYGRLGYSFLGWDDTTARPSVRYTNQAEVVDLAEVGTTNKLRVAWSNNTYRVAYDMGGVEIAGLKPMDHICAYDVSWTLPEEPLPAKGENVFLGWSTDDGMLDKASPMSSVSNLTALANDNVIIHAVWKVDYGEISRTLGGEALKLYFTLSDGEMSGWHCETATTPNGMNRSCEYPIPDDELAAEIRQSGLLTFKVCGIGDGSIDNSIGLKVFFGKEEKYDYNETEGFITNLLCKGMNAWIPASLKLTVGPGETGNRVVFVTDGFDNAQLMIADMRWTPEGGHLEPIDGKHNVTISSLEAVDGKLTIQFDGNAQFDYELMTNADLTATSWGVMETKPGAATVSFEPLILPGQPQLFYKVRTIRKK